MKNKLTKLSLFALLIGTCVPMLCSCKSENKIDSYDLCSEFNTVITECLNNGNKELYESKWYSTDPNKNDLDFSKLSNENGTLKIGLTGDEEPFVYKVEGGCGWSGLCFEYLYEVCSRLKCDFEIESFSSISAAITATSTNKIDALIGCISITEERKESVCFSKPFFQNRVICATRVDNTSIQSKADLADKKVGILSETVLDQYVEEDCDTAIIKRYQTNIDLVTALENGQIDAIYEDYSLFRFINLTHTEIEERYEANNDDKYGFVFPKFGYQTPKELEGKRIGVMEGSVYGNLVEQSVEECSLSEYKDIPSLITALQNNKIDAFASDKSLVFEASKSNPIYTFDVPLLSSPTGAAFPKTEEGNSRRNDFNDYLDEIKDNGTLQNLIDKWENYQDGVTKIETVIVNSNPSTKIHVSISALICPYVFVENNEYTGLEVEIINGYCNSRDIGVEFENMEWGALIPSLSRNDMTVSCISITEERKESVHFSDTIYYSDIVYVAMADSEKNDKDFFTSIGESFTKTFIKENRWKLFLQGTLTTLLITAASIVVGTLLGFIFYLIAYRAGDIAKKILKVYTSILHNIPIVVILMIFYYIFFAKSTISGITVSIIVFSLSFSASVYSMLTTCVSAIDKGQTEAARSLGYSRNKTFFKVILPQTFKQFLPMFKDEIVSHIKATAIVGYVAVEDLTKMSDIVRSRTYESFFPLFVTAIIYFLLAMLLIFIVRKITIVIDPRKRTKQMIIRGVEEHD